MLSVAEKQEIVQKFGRNENDTGSSEVQIAMLTARMAQLMTHFREHKHDNNSKRGFLMLIGQRRRLLRYISKKDKTRYLWLIKELGIRK